MEKIVKSKKFPSVEQFINRLGEAIADHNYGSEVIEDLSNVHNIIGNVVGALPVQVELGRRSKRDALKILKAFNEKTGLDVTWKFLVTGN